MPLTLKQSTFTRLYTDGTNKDTFGNATESAAQAGYKGTRNTQRSTGIENTLKPAIRAEIERIQGEKQAKANWDYDVAIQAIDKRIAYLESKASAGDVYAVNAITALLKEKNSITGLNKQHLITTSEPAPELTVRQEEAVAAANEAYKQVMSRPRLAPDRTG